MPVGDEGIAGIGLDALGDKLYRRKKPAPHREGSDRSHLAQTPDAKPAKTTVRGKPTVKGRAWVHSAKVGKRPDPAAIKAWCDKRKHIEHWRNRDGSYEAIATFKGESAFEQLDAAVRRLPGRPYFAIRYFHKEELSHEKGTAAIKLAGPKGPVWLRVLSSPIVRGESPEEGASWAKLFVYDGDPRLYLRRAGLSVYWPPNNKKGT